MPATKARPQTSAKRKRAQRIAPVTSDVLTLAEAATYLRVPEAAVLREVGPDGLPGRLINGEWRFSKAALQDWLRGPQTKNQKETILKWAGAFKDDPDLEEIVREAYARRGRPMTEDAG